MSEAGRGSGPAEKGAPARVISHETDVLRDVTAFVSATPDGDRLNVALPGRPSGP